jgi:hypothetical protein
MAINSLQCYPGCRQMCIPTRNDELAKFRLLGMFILNAAAHQIESSHLCTFHRSRQFDMPFIGFSFREIQAVVANVRYESH